jgi:hypothetical protein
MAPFAFLNKFKVAYIGLKPCRIHKCPRPVPIKDVLARRLNEYQRMAANVLRALARMIFFVLFTVGSLAIGLLLNYDDPEAATLLWLSQPYPKHWKRPAPLSRHQIIHELTTNPELVKALSLLSDAQVSIPNGIQMNHAETIQDLEFQQSYFKNLFSGFIHLKNQTGIGHWLIPGIANPQEKSIKLEVDLIDSVIEEKKLTRRSTIVQISIIENKTKNKIGEQSFNINL